MLERASAAWLTCLAIGQSAIIAWPLPPLPSRRQESSPPRQRLFLRVCPQISAPKPRLPAAYFALTTDSPKLDGCPAETAPGSPGPSEGDHGPGPSLSSPPEPQQHVSYSRVGDRPMCPTPRRDRLIRNVRGSRTWVDAWGEDLPPSSSLGEQFGDPALNRETRQHASGYGPWRNAFGRGRCSGSM